MSKRLNQLGKRRAEILNEMVKEKSHDASLVIIGRLNENYRDIMAQVRKDHRLTSNEAMIYIARKDTATLKGCDEISGGW